MKYFIDFSFFFWTFYLLFFFFSFLTSQYMIVLSSFEIQYLLFFLLLQYIISCFSIFENTIFDYSSLFWNTLIIVIPSFGNVKNPSPYFLSVNIRYLAAWVNEKKIGIVSHIINGVQRHIFILKTFPLSINREMAYFVNNLKWFRGSTQHGLC